MTFETRAQLADAAVWSVLTDHARNLTDPNDIQAVVAGAVTAVTRLVFHTMAEPGVTETVEAIREMSCVAAVAISKAAKAE